MLQGSLDNFALDEVLGLLSSTGKTGRLDLRGDRGEGSLTLCDGRLVDAAASQTANGTAPEDVVFELLRYVDGAFRFDACGVEPTDGDRDVLEVLAAAEGRLADWRTIEVVVPSLGHRVAPAPDLPAEEVTIGRTEWATLRIIASGCPVSYVCDELGIGEVEGSRRIKALAERGLVEVNAPDPGLGTPSGIEALTGVAVSDAFTDLSTPIDPISAQGTTADPISDPTRATTSPRHPGGMPEPLPSRGPAGVPDPISARGPGAVPDPISSRGPGSVPDPIVASASSMSRSVDGPEFAPDPTTAVASSTRSPGGPGGLPSPPPISPSRPVSAPAVEPPPPPAVDGAGGPRAARPPMPVAPSADDLRDLDLPPAGDDAPSASDGSDAGTSDETAVDAEPKPGGLLMRYLQSEES